MKTSLGPQSIRWRKLPNGDIKTSLGVGKAEISSHGEKGQYKWFARNYDSKQSGVSSSLLEAKRMAAAALVKMEEGHIEKLEKAYRDGLGT